MEYAPDSRFLASGCGDGSVRIFNSIGRLSYTLNIGKSTALPTTCIRFRPAGLSGNKGVVVVASKKCVGLSWYIGISMGLWADGKK